MGASEVEIERPVQIGEGSFYDDTVGEAVGANEFAAELTQDESPESQTESVHVAEVVSKEPAEEKEDGPTPARIMFQNSMNTLFTFWGATLDSYAGQKVSPPDEIKLLCCMAWTDVAEAMGWLEHADDPVIAALLATGLTGGTYGVATYHVIQAKRGKA